MWARGDAAGALTQCMAEVDEAERSAASVPFARAGEAFAVATAAFQLLAHSPPPTLRRADGCAQIGGCGAGGGGSGAVAAVPRRRSGGTGAGASIAARTVRVRLMPAAQAVCLLTLLQVSTGQSEAAGEGCERWFAGDGGRGDIPAAVGAADEEGEVTEHIQ